MNDLALYELVLFTVSFAVSVMFYLQKAQLFLAAGNLLIAIAAAFGIRRYDVHPSPEEVHRHAFFKQIASTFGIGLIAIGLYENLTLGLFLNYITQGILGASLVSVVLARYHHNDGFLAIAQAAVVTLFGYTFYLNHDLVLGAAVAVIVGRQALTTQTTKLSLKRVELLRRLALAVALVVIYFRL